MAEYKDREHYIPLRKSDLVELLCRDKQLPVQEREPLRQFCTLVSAVFHFEYLKQLEELKDAYAPFDPDADTRELKPASAEGRAKGMGHLFERFTSLMERANFRHLSRQEIENLLQAVSSDWGLDMHVDLDMFERLEVFARGDVVGARSRRSWRKLWQREEVKVPEYQRLVLIIKLKPDVRVDRDIDTSGVFLKVFKDFPKMDVDMLLPGAKVRLSRLDKALIIGPLVTGVGLLLYKIFGDIWEAIQGNETARAGMKGLMWGLAVGLAGYGYKSYYSYSVKKQNYNLRLTKSLYYRSLDNNKGVLMRLLDEAEEQECRETFLAYYCLWRYSPPQGWTPEQLDDYVELYLEQHANLKVDFEIGDALAKLERLKIVYKSGNAYRAVPIDKALEMLDWTWDNYFKYNNPEPEVPPIP
jgi:hypothetical protein